MYGYPRTGLESYAPSLTSAAFVAAQQASDWFPHRDASGIVFMWSDSVEGPPPLQAPPERIIDAQGRFVYGTPEQAGILPSGEAVPPFGPVAPTPPEAYWAESVPRPRRFSLIGPPALTQVVERPPGYIQLPSGTGPNKTVDQGGILDDAKKKTLKELGLLALLTSPVWAPVLLSVVLRR